MAIKIASWNVEGRLSGYAKSGRGSAGHIVDGIELLNAAVVILPEAYLEDVAPGVDDRLKALGYEWHDVEYGQSERDWSREYLGKIPSLRVMSRLPIMDIRKNYWGGLRHMVSFTVSDPETEKPVRIFATHLDDRSEELRERQVTEAVEELNATVMPKVMIGDLNAMWPSGRARIFGSRMLRFLAGHIPAAGLRHTLTRLADMATGRVLGRLKNEAGLHDADPRHMATTTPKMRDRLYMPSIRLAQIDHALISDEIGVRDFTIGPDGGSDHRAIAVTIVVKGD